MSRIAVEYHRELQPVERPRSLYVVKDDPAAGRTVAFYPHEGQQAALYSPARITAFVSGTQGGKSVLGPFWLYTRMRGFSVPELGIDVPAMGEGTYLAVSPTYDLTNLKVIPELIKFFEHTMGIGRWFAGDRILELKEPPKLDDGSYDYDNWSNGKFLAVTSSSPMWGQIIVRSAESKGGLESSTARAAWLDEAGMPSFSRDAWEAILRRLSISRGPILITTTPYFPGGWMKSDVFDPADKQDPSVRLVRIPSYVNPSFSVEEYEDRRAKMAPARFRMMYMGIPTQLTGMIYPDFDSVNMRVPAGKTLMMNASTWTFVGGIDFGWHADFAVVLMALSPSGVVYLLRSHKRPETLLDDHMILMRDWMDSLPAGASVKWIADPSGKLEIETLKARGFWVEAGMNTPGAIIGGIDAFTALIRTGRFWLYGSHSKFLDEIANYVWQEGQDEQPMDKPKKGNDHIMDACRYCVSGISNYTPLATGSPQLLQRKQTDIRQRALAAVNRRGANSTDALKARLLGR